MNSINSINSMNPIVPPPTVSRPPEGQPKVLDSKVVYLKERGNKWNRGFAQYSSSPVAGTEGGSSKSPRRRKQTLSSMKFTGKRTHGVHECFKESPELLARDAFESVMSKIRYRPPAVSLDALAESECIEPLSSSKSQSASPSGSDSRTSKISKMSIIAMLKPPRSPTLSPSEEAVRVIAGSLNKLTVSNFENVVAKCTSSMDALGIRECGLSTLNKLGETFHCKVSGQKELVRLYANFLVELSKSPALVVHGRTLKDIVLELGWKAIDSQQAVHDKYSAQCVAIQGFYRKTNSARRRRRSKRSKKSKLSKNHKVSELPDVDEIASGSPAITSGEGADDIEDDVAMKALKEEYSLWLERLYGNYVLITELYCQNRANFVFDRLHKVLLQLIATNQSWTWKILFVVLTFHGVALQKKETKHLEEYLEAIDDVIEGIHYEQKQAMKGGNRVKSVSNGKYRHIPLRIKYLLMAVQEHIETQNAHHIEGRGFLNPMTIDEVHLEYCREHGMTPEELKKQLAVHRIETKTDEVGVGLEQHPEGDHSDRKVKYQPVLQTVSVLDLNLSDTPGSMNLNVSNSVPSLEAVTSDPIELSLNGECMGSDQFVIDNSNDIETPSTPPPTSYRSLGSHHDTPRTPMTPMTPMTPWSTRSGQSGYDEFGSPTHRAGHHEDEGFGSCNEVVVGSFNGGHHQDYDGNEPLNEQYSHSAHSVHSGYKEEQYGHSEDYRYDDGYGHSAHRSPRSVSVQGEYQCPPRFKKLGVRSRHLHGHSEAIPMRTVGTVPNGVTRSVSAPSVLPVAPSKSSTNQSKTASGGAVQIEHESVQNTERFEIEQNAISNPADCQNSEDSEIDKSTNSDSEIDEIDQFKTTKSAKSEYSENSENSENATFAVLADSECAEIEETNSEIVVDDDSQCARCEAV